MDQEYIEEEVFEGNNFAHNPLPANSVFELCIFANCDFSNSNLASIKFMECEFNDCNLSMANITNTVFREIKFKDSKILGVKFDNCNDLLLSVNFKNCILNHSSFYKTDLKKGLVLTSANLGMERHSPTACRFLFFYGDRLCPRKEKRTFR